MPRPHRALPSRRSRRRRRSRGRGRRAAAAGSRRRPLRFVSCSGSLEEILAVPSQYAWSHRAPFRGAGLVDAAAPRLKNYQLRRARRLVIAEGTLGGLMGQLTQGILLVKFAQELGAGPRETAAL